MDTLFKCWIRKKHKKIKTFIHRVAPENEEYRKGVKRKGTHVIAEFGVGGRGGYRENEQAGKRIAREGERRKMRRKEQACSWNWRGT
jgi:hypothetical protein